MVRIVKKVEGFLRNKTSARISCAPKAKQAGHTWLPGPSSAECPSTSWPLGLKAYTWKGLVRQRTR